MNAPIVSRLAPTPSGYLHLGNAYNFLLNWLYARTAGGKVLLRIDDLDAARVRDEYLDNIFLTLDRLGLDWDMGPSGVGDFKKHWSQTLRIDKYTHTLQRLAQTGALFACTCSRKTLEGATVYPRICNHKNISLYEADVAWRLHLAEDTQTLFDDLALGAVSFATGAEAGCAVMRRRDAVPAYHIASLTDDIAFGVNTMVRGMDLLPSTALQLHLAERLGESSFLRARFSHHPLLTDVDGNKLSKSAGATSMRYLFSQGYSTALFIQHFAAWQTWALPQNIRTVQQLAEWRQEKQLGQ